MVTPKAMASDGAELRPEPRPGTTAEVLAATEYPAEDCAVCFEVLGEAWSRTVNVKNSRWKSVDHVDHVDHVDLRMVKLSFSLSFIGL